MGQLLWHINKLAGSLGSRSFKTKSQALYFLWSHLPPDTVSFLSPVPLLTLAVKTRSKASLRKMVDEGGAGLSLVSVSVDSKSVRMFCFHTQKSGPFQGLDLGRGVHEPLSKPLPIIQFYRMMRIGYDGSGRVQTINEAHGNYTVYKAPGPSSSCQFSLTWNRERNAFESLAFGCLGDFGVRHKEG